MLDEILANDIEEAVTIQRAVPACSPGRAHRAPSPPPGTALQASATPLSSNRSPAPRRTPAADNFRVQL